MHCEISDLVKKNQCRQYNSQEFLKMICPSLYFFKIQCDKRHISIRDFRGFFMFLKPQI